MPDRTCKGKDFAGPCRLIALGGPKQSGKSSAANFIAGINLVCHGVIEEFISNDDGSIAVGSQQVHVNDIDPSFVKIYNFADSLKNICCDLFNIDRRLAYGSNADKETLTDLRWEDMPGVITCEKTLAEIKRVIDRKIKLRLLPLYKSLDLIYHPPGPMSVRDILMYFGTDVCRKMYGQCWVNYLMSQIKRESPAIALVADMRFDNEAEAIKQAGGHCILMSKMTFQSSHVSENGFVTFQDWDVIVRNEACEDIRCLNKILYDSLKDLGVFDKIEG